ncbi:hypothetical protein [Nereida sp.]|uniref:hypothetical protein n=1 Tax=Nereida sp. TaxID=2736090 RepID=UPI003F69B1B1
MTPQDIQHKADEVASLLREKLSVRGKTLGDQLGRSGAVLPRRVRAKGRLLAHAATVAEHPQLAKKIDPAAVLRAHSEVCFYLSEINPRDRRMGFVLVILGRVTFALLITGAAFVGLLVWRGNV